MKSNLMLKKFSTNTVPGTMNQKEIKTFFGSKVMYSEGDIWINDDSIQFKQVVDIYNNGYQYFESDTIPDEWEINFSENLSDLKMNNQKISLLSQSSENMVNNTRWQITINGTSILKDYLFFRLKEQRTFKMINAIDVYSNDINTAIYDYITNNLLSRYRLIKVDFYVSYYDIKKQSIYDKIRLQYNPNFNVDVYDKMNNTNASVINFDPYKFDALIVQYNQSKPSNQYSFNYYFDLKFSSANYQSVSLTTSQQQSMSVNSTASAL
jgi:hypothetical protein